MYTLFLDLINIHSASSQKSNSKSVTDRIHVFCYGITKYFTNFFLFFFIGKIEVKFTCAFQDKMKKLLDLQT